MDKISVNLDDGVFYRPKRWAWLLGLKWSTLIGTGCHGYWEGVNVYLRKPDENHDEIDGNTLDVANAERILRVKRMESNRWL